MTGTPHDFDFLIGDWNMINRRLRTVLANCDDWYEFPSTLTCRHMLDGVANVDEMRAPTQGFNGMSVRTFDVERREWSIYWINDRRGRLELPPVVGVFTAGVGVFTCDDTHEGRPIRVRYTWSEITATSARWDQAFSTDGGETWETNWIMDFTRA